MDENVKLKVQVQRVFFPKKGKNISGQWSSFSCSVVEALEGEPVLNKYGTINCSGANVPEFDKNETYILYAKLKIDDKWGPQYVVASMGTEYNLNCLEDQLKFLSFILTEKQIKLLYETLENPFDFIKEGNIKELTKVKGIGLKIAQSIIDKYDSNAINAEAYVELADFGLTKNAIDKLVDRFGTQGAVRIIKEDPYSLISLVRGYGWKKADDIAMKTGFSEHDIRRVSGYMMHLIQTRELEGNTFTFTNHFLEDIESNLNYPPKEVIRDAMYALGEKGLIWWDENKDKIFSLKMINTEKEIAQELKRLQTAENTLEYRDLEEVLPKIEEENGWEFTDEQKEAVLNTLKSNVSIITGAGGTGKTSVVSAILQCCTNADFAQTALAGRAAARMGEVTGESGYTIHRLLGYLDGQFVHNRSNPLPYNLIILDEVSMIGGDIFLSLISAIRSGAKLIMLGDVGQLEAIGTLNLFRDMLDSELISVSQLTKIHRQAAKSAIITTSIDVREQNQIFKQGYVGKAIWGELRDLELDIYNESILTQRKIVRHFKNLVAEGVEPNDIQVVVPMRFRGDSSTYALNPILKELANPYSKESILLSKTYNGTTRTYNISVGDRVINTRNNYKAITLDNTTRPIFNGNMGVVTYIDEDEMIIDFFQWGEIIVIQKYFGDIELAYAITCHKLQGSQSPYVIVGLDNSAYTMLTKEWLYTALTRAQKYCVLCGQNSAIEMAIDTSKVPDKQTMLKAFLDGEYDIESVPLFGFANLDSD